MIDRVRIHATEDIIENNYISPRVDGTGESLL